MACLIIGNYLKYNTKLLTLYDISARVYCVAQLLWYIILSLYTIIITSEKNEKILNIVKKSTKITKVILIILSIITFILPVKYDYLKGGIISYTGIRSDFMTVIIIAIALLGIISIIINWKDINNKKKIFPFITLVLMQVLAYGVFWIDNTINILPLSITLISYLMYHTIENPDIKLISELKVARNIAETANASKSDFLASMSHEIRTPLNAIIGFSQLIRENDNIEEIHVDNKDIMLASRNLLEIVKTILDINLIEENKIEIEENDYNIRSLLNELVNIINLKVERKQLELRTNFSYNLPIMLYGDKEKIKRIIFNLLTNAVKYTEKGFIDFNVECEVVENECNLRINVTDTGRGISDDQKEKIFTKFYRMEEDKDSDIEGTGLGLAFTKALVELLNGSIEVQSVYGQGTTFSVTIKQKISNDNSTNENIDINQNSEEIELL